MFYLTSKSHDNLVNSFGFMEGGGGEGGGLLNIKKSPGRIGLTV